MTKPAYFPATVFNAGGGTTPRVMVAPQRYVQGAGVLEHIHRYMSLLNCQRAGLLASRRGLAAEGARITESLAQNRINVVPAQFEGECSLAEVDKHVAALADAKLDCLIAVGGGKPVDAGKSIAYRLDIPVVIVPTLASNDAPCSALSVLYTEQGASDLVEFYPSNPALVVVDTDIVAAADERYLVAGMGDAMATWYEARVCLNNPKALTPIGARPTLASCAMGEICAHTLFDCGLAAASAVAANRNDDDVERVVEANTLLSGIGFESGGLALAHPMALAFTQIDAIHHNYLHGEMVAMGTMIQLAMERSPDAQKVAEFFAATGLPVHLQQLSLATSARADLEIIIAAALQNRNSHHMPMPVTAASIQQAIEDADALGQRVAAEVGDSAYRRLQGM
ncbi:MAG: iron-containing alcohol dehydrogenase [Proteobacteria bacterium]|nr:iron-containing alcohol dehydrogenase [Pseudomonadota bacterium]